MPVSSYPCNGGMIEISLYQKVPASGTEGVAFKLWRIACINIGDLVPGHFQEPPQGLKRGRGFVELIPGEITAHMQNGICSAMIRDPLDHFMPFIHRII